MRMAAGIDVVPNYHEAPIDPEDMLTRATKAMRQSRTDAGNGSWIRQFETADAELAGRPGRRGRQAGDSWPVGPHRHSRSPVAGRFAAAGDRCVHAIIVYIRT